MSEVLKKFDRYFLLDRIAQGGMAEIYRARMASSDVGGRIIVIKRIQTGYGANAEFVTMFKSEIKVTMGFNHPNIVQVHDCGESENQPFIAMEFVDGRNLRQFLNRFTELNQSFPVDLAAYTVEQSAAGLFYAHSFKDKISGESLGIIHRDISPQNILISYEGTVKVIDFGIAKAATNGESTRAGVIKGKPSYLSPEQISGENLDARCDIFALGTVLWELLTGRKLFAGDNDLAVLKMIESCGTHVKPPSTINSDVPKELDHIVLKSLAKQREARYQTCDEFRRALHKFIYSFNPDFNPGDLSYYAKELFKGEIVEDRKKVQKLYERAETLLSTDVGFSVQNNSGQTVIGVESATPTVQEETTTVFNLNPDNAAIEPLLPVAEAAPSKPIAAAPTRAPASPPLQVNRPQVGGTRTQLQRPVPQPETSSATKIVAALLAVGLLGLYLTRNSPSSPVCSVFGSCSGAEQPKIAQIEPPQQPAQVQPSTAAPIPVQDVSKLGPKKIYLRFRVPAGITGATATLAGQPVDLNASVIVGMDQLLDLSITRPGYRPYRNEFTIFSDKLAVGQSEYIAEVALEPVSFGFITIRTTPSADATLIPRDGRHPTEDGKTFTKRTPFEQEKVPVGTYNVRLVNDVLGMEKTVTIQVQENSVVTVDERLDVRN